MGKKRQFNEEEILDKLATHFWKHGYSATKVDQLSKITGLTKTTSENFRKSPPIPYLSLPQLKKQSSYFKMILRLICLSRRVACLIFGQIYLYFLFYYLFG